MAAIPDICNHINFGAARIREIKAITSKLESCEHGGRAFQNLPRHMQRRTVSKDPKRLPKYLREKHLREGGDKVKPTRRHRREYRHRPQNHLAEYNRRQSETLWLETHVWHAKRFHMTRQWGYALPVAPTMKGHRSTHRAALNSCTIQDISYYCCIELEGPIEQLVSGLTSVTLPSDLDKLSNPQVSSGRRWITISLFKINKQPYGAVGDVDVLCYPMSLEHKDLKGEQYKLWVWVHPSAYSDVIKLLLEAYGLQKVGIGVENNNVEEVVGGVVEPMDATSEKENDTSIKDEEKKMKVDEKKFVNGKWNETTKNKDVDKGKLAKKNIPFTKAPKYTSNVTGVTMALLKDTTNKFRLTGPKAYEVLKAALISANIKPSENDTNSPWWRHYYLSKERQEVYDKQQEAWGHLSSCPPPPCAVLPLIIRDPRVTLPHKRLPIEAINKDQTTELTTPNWPVNNPMFDSAVRDEVTQTREPDHIINQWRSTLLVPGQRLQEYPGETRVPLILLSRPPTHSAGHGSGWDLVMPGGWAMNIWMSLIFCGGVAVGQTASTSLHMEILTPLTPNLNPDTPAAESYSLVQGQERRVQYFKKPPAKRHNFNKLGVQYPFSPPWRKLIGDWNVGADDLFVLRDKVALNKIAEYCGDAARRLQVIRKLKRKDPAASAAIACKSLKLEVDVDDNTESKITSNSGIEDTPAKDDNEKSNSTSPVSTLATMESRMMGSQGENYNSGLVMVRLELDRNGVLEPCAMICVPTLEDWNNQMKSKKPSERKEAVVETQHKDVQEELRVQLSKEHDKIKAKVRRLRKKARAKVVEDNDMLEAAERDKSVSERTTEAIKAAEEENKEVLAKHRDYNSAMEEAWLTPTTGSLQCCDRTIMGYVTQGGFLLSMGRGGGIGWVCYKALLKLITLHSDNFVLVRCPSSLQYLWAKLTIVVQPD